MGYTQIYIEIHRYMICPTSNRIALICAPRDATMDQSSCQVDLAMQNQHVWEGNNKSSVHEPCSTLAQPEGNLYRPWGYYFDILGLRFRFCIAVRVHGYVTWKCCSAAVTALGYPAVLPTLMRIIMTQDGPNTSKYMGWSAKLWKTGVHKHSPR